MNVNKYSRGLFLAAMAAAATLFSACSTQTNASQTSQPTTVGVYTLKRQRYTIKTTLPGRAAAYMTSDVRPQVEGIIEKRLFKEGSEVYKGQALYQLDPAKYQAAYDSANADLAEARAAVQSARPKAERYIKAAKIDAVSEQDKDDAVATLAQDRATVQADKAALETARINLDYTRIKAPISGVISASTYTPGALVTDAQDTALATIRQLDPIYVDIKQTDTRFLDLKQALRQGKLATTDDNKVKVEISPAGNPGIKLDGRLEFAGASVDETSGTVTLRAIVQNPNHDLLPGMYVNATLPQGVATKALLVPQQAVTRDDSGNAHCLVVNAKDKVISRSLQIAAAAGNRWRVIQGLAAGDRVIVQGLGKVNAGDTVKTVAVDAEGKALKSNDDTATSSADTGVGTDKQDHDTASTSATGG
ncbi:efflux RND transporter periplasmic adaptor subunit [Salinisphaera hydrothermalis]|uniref:efflux RND transporter periplasmic adaptor subunit n=1 Tax=Salinisphaera hydrothermalis TaxID=563188 RepID=UPI00333E430D